MEIQISLFRPVSGHLMLMAPVALQKATLCLEIPKRNV